MAYSLTENGHAVLLPAFADVHLHEPVRKFLDRGGCSLLLGESREEYVARRMSSRRVSEESGEKLGVLTAEARSLTDHLLVAVDQEPGGICRLHDLVPRFPEMRDSGDADPSDLKSRFEAVASAARSMGINCFLSPILDCVTGDNPWLAGRTWSTDCQTIADVSALFIRTIQDKGIVAGAKHFPGYAHIPLDPAVDPEARNTQPAASFEDGFVPFQAAIDAGVEMIMTGPAVVEAFDPENSASVSPAIISLLRERFGFRGLVLSDDLDAPAILRGSSIEEMAVQALQAGSDLLLIADIDDQVEHIAESIIAAVERGTLSEERLADAATRVRRLAQRYRL